MGGGGQGKATLKRKTERPKTEGAPRSPGLNSSRSSGVANCSQAWNGFLGRESTAWQGWHGPGLPPIGIAGLARARELGIAGLGGAGHVTRTSHALLPNLVSTCEVSKSLAVPAGGSGAASRRRGSASGCMRSAAGRTGGATRRSWKNCGARGVRASLARWGGGGGAGRGRGRPYATLAQLTLTHP